MIDQLYYSATWKSFSMQSSIEKERRSRPGRLIYEKKNYDMSNHFIRFIEMVKLKFKKSDWSLRLVEHQWFWYWTRYSMETGTIKNAEWNDVPKIEELIN